MPPMRVVEPLDVREEGGARLGVGPERVPRQQLTLQGGEEGLGDRVVVAVAARVHRGYDSRDLATLPEARRGVLAAVVGVMDHTGGRVPIPERLLQGRQDELGAQMV